MCVCVHCYCSLCKLIVPIVCLVKHCFSSCLLGKLLTAIYPLFTRRLNCWWSVCVKHPYASPETLAFLTSACHIVLWSFSCSDVSVFLRRSWYLWYILSWIDMISKCVIDTPDMAKSTLALLWQHRYFRTAVLTWRQYWLLSQLLCVHCSPNKTTAA